MSLLKLTFTLSMINTDTRISNKAATKRSWSNMIETLNLNRSQFTSGITYTIRLPLNLKEERLTIKKNSIVIFNFLNFIIADFYVDFLLPEKQTIIEVEGPAHFIAPTKERNQTTEARYRILQKKGFKIIKIPYFVNEISTDPNYPSVRMEDLLEDL
jgi:very-short-patch-repair endonuclease